MPTPLEPADACRLCEFFTEAKYTREEIRKGPVLQELSVRSSEPQLASLDDQSEPSALKLLLRWFCLGEAAGCDDSSGLIPAPILALLLESGMLVRTGSMLAPAVMVTPHDRSFFAADTVAHWKSHSADVVIWPNPTTQLLDQFTIRRPVDSALDLGAGCGIQAVLAARHSRRVTATDLNPRAAEFVRFNAWLNGAENIECLTGDTFDPVRNLTFDLILSNPPFFVTPSGKQLYCETGAELDGYCRRVVTEAGRHLNEGGYAQVVLEWVQVRGEAWQDRLRAWLEDSGCDAWLFRSYARAAADYARERIRQDRSQSESESLAHWLDYYNQRGVEEIHGGILAMRRRPGRNWVRIEELPLGPSEPFGDSVWQSFACIDCLESHGDDALLGIRPRLSPDAVLEEQLKQADGRWQPTAMTLRMTRGIPHSMRLDPAVAQFIARLDGRQSLGEVTAAFAREIPADPQLVRQECLAAVRRLMERCFLLP